MVLTLDEADGELVLIHLNKSRRSISCHFSNIAIKVLLRIIIYNYE